MRRLSTGSALAWHRPPRPASRSPTIGAAHRSHGAWIRNARVWTKAEARRRRLQLCAAAEHGLPAPQSGLPRLRASSGLCSLLRPTSAAPGQLPSRPASACSVQATCRRSPHIAPPVVRADPSTCLFCPHLTGPLYSLCSSDATHKLHSLSRSPGWHRRALQARLGSVPLAASRPAYRHRREPCKRSPLLCPVPTGILLTLMRAFANRDGGKACIALSARGLCKGARGAVEAPVLCR